MNELKSKHQQVIEIVDQVLTSSTKLGITQIVTEDEQLNGRTILVKGNDLINFGSCSYLGLELDKRLIEGAVDAVRKYGTQFSSSRAYVSVTLYEQLENLLGKIFGKPIILAPTVTLGHLSNIPVLVGDDDAVILDSQVHDCVQTAVQLLKSRNVHTEVIRHNRMDILEDRINQLRSSYQKIWYMADGVYSMYGDFIPINQLNQLMEDYEQFHVYVDDAHGMSWSGQNGSGYVLSEKTISDKLYLVSGLAKGFGAAGGVLIFPDEGHRRLVRNCGKTLIFSGPIQPPVLGAAIESAKIHLSPEISTIQQQLAEKITFFNETCRRLNLPLIRETNSPIFFIGVGKPVVGYNMVRRLMNLGYYINLSVFPSVSYNNTGLRIPITNHHTFGDIENLLQTISQQLPLALHDTQSSMKEIFRFFKLAS